MKIGILTFWWSNDNYGQLLQCYALQKYLRNMGHEVYFIKYNYTLDLKKTPFAIRCLKALNPVFLIRYIVFKIQHNKFVFEEKKFNRGFEEFRKKYFVFSEKFYQSYNDLKTNPPEADIYIVGSDQVWNYWNFPITIFRNPLHTYFLDFGEKNVKKLSYAASWGITTLPEAYTAEIKPLLKKFNYVSVREENGIELCQKCGYEKSEWVCDPTLLLDKETYRKLYLDILQNNKVLINRKRYIFLYILANECDFDIHFVYNFAAKKDLDVVYVTGNHAIDKHKKFFATIPEWLYLVDNAEYVITNSFHCAVFSSIFHKSFGVIPLSGVAAGMNERFNSLFLLLGTGNRYITNADFSILNEEYEVKNVHVSNLFLKELSN